MLHNCLVRLVINWFPRIQVLGNVLMLTIRVNCQDLLLIYRTPSHGCVILRGFVRGDSSFQGRFSQYGRVRSPHRAVFPGITQPCAAGLSFIARCFLRNGWRSGEERITLSIVSRIGRRVGPQAAGHRRHIRTAPCPSAKYERQRRCRHFGDHQGDRILLEN